MPEDLGMHVRPKAKLSTENNFKGYQPFAENAVSFGNPLSKQELLPHRWQSPKMKIRPPCEISLWDIRQICWYHQRGRKRGKACEVHFFVIHIIFRAPPLSNPDGVHAD